ncbi:hypothetical protein DXG01_008287 [Tephrocybe rancida]|nr:hypothetical protein DXG01_008287 [Tephrocybe rancida]
MEYLKDDTRRDYSGHLHPKAPIITWIPKVSHVCSYWREVALSTPTLWSNIPIHNASWATEMVQRSKAAPLTISYGGTWYFKRSAKAAASHAVLESVLQSHLSRIRNLTLAIRPNHGFDESEAIQKRFTRLLTILEQPAPLLERLEITSSLKTTLESKKLIIRVAASPPLAYLTLLGYSIPWEAPVSRCIRSLDIRRIPENSRPSVTQLLGLLSHTPLLESLLIGRIQASHGTLPPHNIIVNLGRLEIITILGDLPAFACLFDGLVFSRHARLVLHLMPTRPDFNNSSVSISLFQSLARKFEDGVEGAVSKLDVLEAGIWCWKTKNLQMPAVEELASIHIAFPNDSFPHWFYFAQSLSLGQMQSLNIDTPGIEEDTLLLFSNLPLIRSLRFALNEYSLLKVLRHGMEEDHPVLCPSFPALKSLTIVDWDMDLVQEGNTVAYWLATCFRLRMKAGLGLKLLKLEDCLRVDRNDPNRLRTCIEKIRLEILRLCTFPTTALQDTARVYIQEKLKDYKSIIRYYHEHLNALTVTCLLPPEVLGAIFSWVIDATPNAPGHENEDYEPYPKSGQNLRWIPRVSHVCSHWREVALSTSNLWTNIPVGKPSWGTEMVQRSKAAPLTISYVGSLCSRSSGPKAERSHFILKTVLCSHLSRLTSLALKITSSSSQSHASEMVKERFTTLLGFLEQPAPLLEHLDIRNSYLSDTVTLPNGIAAASPRVAQITLWGCGMAWEAAAFKHLKALAVTYLPENLRPSATQVLSLLSQTPLLEWLSIGSPLSSSGTLPPQTTTVNLGRLNHITIRGDLSDCAYLFSRLAFSKNARKIFIHILSVSTQHDSSVSWMELVGQRFDHGIDNDISRLVLGNEIKCWKSKEPRMSEYTDPNIHIRHPIYFPAGRLGFLQSLSQNQLRSLEITVVNIEEDTLLLVGDLPHLERLSVVSNELTMLKVLRRRMTTKQDSVTPWPLLRPAFSALQTLTIVKWALGLTQDDKDVATQLATCFRLRSKAGLCLELLELKECEGLYQEDLGHLRKRIETVTWDGHGAAG